MAVLVKGLGDRNVALKNTHVALLHLVMETLENRYLEAGGEDSRL